MTEREELEYAAKAYGLVGYEYVEKWRGMATRRTEWKDFDSYWNPLKDDGDCGRLEAALGIWVTWQVEKVHVYTLYKTGLTELYSKHNNDKQKARRHAVTRLAAEIGKAMQK